MRVCMYACVCVWGGRKAVLMLMGVYGVLGEAVVRLCGPQTQSDRKAFGREVSLTDRKMLLVNW